MYVSCEEAKRQIVRRWNDLALRRKVRDYVGEIPQFLRHGPRAVLARQVATPNFESLHFADAADAMGLKPLWAEYLGDSFCTHNPDKRKLGKLTFFHGKGRNGGDRTSCHKVIDLVRSDRRPLRRIETLWQERFVDFHHRMLAAALPGVEVADFTVWLGKMGASPARFWPRHLALYLCHGVLFDNFHSEGQERAFTRDIIRPAIATIEEAFGLKPLVVALLPVERARETHWSWYPGSLEQETRPTEAESAAGLFEGRVRHVG